MGSPPQSRSSMQRGKKLYKEIKEICKEVFFFFCFCAKRSNTFYQTSLLDKPARLTIRVLLFLFLIAKSEVKANRETVPLSNHFLQKNNLSLFDRFLAFISEAIEWAAPSSSKTLNCLFATETLCSHCVTLSHSVTVSHRDTAVLSLHNYITVHHLHVRVLGQPDGCDLQGILVFPI